MVTQSQNKVVAFDTNMLLAFAQFKTDIFSQAKGLFGEKVDFVVPKMVLVELRSLARKSKKMEKDVELVFGIIKKNNVMEIDEKAQNTDEFLEKLAAKGIIIATNDRALRKKIKVFGSHIFLKKKRFLAFE